MDVDRRMYNHRALLLDDEKNCSMHHSAWEQNQILLQNFLQKKVSVIEVIKIR